nr:RHS repeat-associated core domain-containing protein [Nonomuraea turkmeniaca]
MASGLHGSTQLAIDEATGQISRERYLPYGQRRGSDDLPFTDRGFLGKTEDDSTGLDYLSARYYDPAIGKFVSTDPLLDLSKPQWTNPYSYGGNNPIGASDPTGLKVIDDAGPSDPCAKPKSVACKAKRKQEAEAALRAAQAEVDRQLRLLIDAVLAIAKIAADELGITAGIQCFSTGNLGACGETALNILGSLAGGLAGKLAVKYGLPWKWKKAYELGKRVWKHAGDAISAFKNWLAAKDRLKLASKKVQEATEALNAACPISRPKSSFVPGTAVVMADGTYKPIEEVDVGDRVLATDPETGQVRAEPVTAVITSKGVKNLVRITVDTDGERGEATGTIIATATHRFWLVEPRAWVEASALAPGVQLRTSGGQSQEILAIARWTAGEQRVHNLTVARTHTYHVRTGATDVLVHNDNNPLDESCRVVRDERNWIPWKEYVAEVIKQIRNKHRGGQGYESGRHGAGFSASATELQEFVRANPHLLPEIKQALLDKVKEWRAKARGTDHRGGRS